MKKTRILWINAEDIRISNIPIGLEEIENFLGCEMAIVVNRQSYREKEKRIVVKQSLDGWQGYINNDTISDVISELDPDKPIYLAYKGWTWISPQNVILRSFMKAFGFINNFGAIGHNAIIFQDHVPGIVISKVS